MKHMLLIIAMLGSGCAIARERFTFLGKTIVLEDSLGAALANRIGDAYTSDHTPFDRSIRLQTNGTTTERDYLQTAAKSMRSWNAQELSALKQSLATLQKQATSLKLRIPMPDTIRICKTTAAEELGADGYTRGNRIMLNVAAEDLSPALLSHELWHVISRLNPALRDRAYANFGFRPCNRIDYKPAFGGQVISNPDCPFLEHYISIEKDGKQQDVTLVLYSRSPYVEGRGGLMEYAAVALLALDGDDKHKHPRMRDGKPVMYDLAETEDFYRQAGRNTGYMLHIEELTAEHFSALMTGREMKQMTFLKALQNELR